MPNEAPLRELARRAIRAGKLPREKPVGTWAGHGSGASCSVCEQPIKHDDVEYEVDVAHDGNNPGLDQFRFHLRCFAVWEPERTKPAT